MTCKQIHHALIKKVRGISNRVTNKDYIPTYSPTALAQEIHETKVLCDELLEQLKNMEGYSEDVKELLAELQGAA
jgi:hypothetical protein